MFLLLQNVSVLEVPTRVSISFAMEIYPSTSPSMISTVHSHPVIFPRLLLSLCVCVCVCERERERERDAPASPIPYLSQSVFVVLVNKKPDHKEKEKHRRWDSETFFFQRCQMKIMGMILLSPTTSSPLSTDHSNSISSSSSNSRINML